MIMHAKIQKWGNGLALRVSGLMREVPHFQVGTEVDIEVNSTGFVVKKAENKKNTLFPLSEKMLIDGLTSALAHADLLAMPVHSELGE